MGVADAVATAKNPLLGRGAGGDGLGITSVLVANRGEIAVRIIRTLRELGIRAIAVHSDADADARHVRAADLAVRLGPAPARESYLDIDAVLEAARVSGARAVHPGYGFLAENAGFVRACEAAGLVFIGPSATAVELMGDKIAARRTVAEVGVAVVPGRSVPGMDDAALIKAAGQIGYPVLIKPSAGGGGKGMRIVRAPAGMAEALASARRESAAAFGDDTLFVERLISQPRHVEVQVLADQHGAVLHLGERECSLQRRHQKIIEEAPSPLLDPRTRIRLGAAAVAVARAVGYVGAGTVEFIMSADVPDEFYFMEMNTRLQVEHAVTELVTGVDLVAEQIRIAAGEPLLFGQADVRTAGHAVEARVYAENPARGFLPTGGDVLDFREPAGPALRVDAGIATGDTVGTDYDPMVAKIVAWGADRRAALSRLDAALAGTVLLGVSSNIGFLRALLDHPDVRAGRLDTGLIERDLGGLVRDDPPAEAIYAYALVRLLALQPTGALIDPWDVPSGWRPGEPAWLSWEVVLPPAGTGAQVGAAPSATSGSRSTDVGANGVGAGSETTTGGAEAAGHNEPAGEITPAGGVALSGMSRTVRVSARGTPASARVRLGENAPVPASVRVVKVDGERDLLITIGSVTTRWSFAWATGESTAVDRTSNESSGRVLWLGRDGRAWGFAEAPAPSTRPRAAAHSGAARSPMPGTVTAVLVTPGETVVAGTPLAIVEAMKMEHPVTAPVSGVVAEVHAHRGDQVRLDQLLVVVAAPSADGPGPSPGPGPGTEGQFGTESDAGTRTGTESGADVSAGTGIGAAG
ncbi:biotin carboxylase N-terminal domain-containing protein [Frankia sp. R82]|uniref:ATP-binding protein n=1 Tax=Frankia sp. R82 TaxID=2950553 RepID=UPI002043CBFF|nr:biotin carboxylase N-terminal domain-containing protein [Frankia sp. R82]MCM3883317.1 ATP-grasp domain-containing protein [Frankia sp. R82]